MSNIVKVLSCACNPGHVYPTSSAYSQHKKSQRHKAWEFGQKSEKIEAKRRDDEIFTLNLKLKDREEQIEKLIIEKNKLSEKFNEITSSSIGNCKALEESQQQVIMLLSHIENTKTINAKLRKDNKYYETLMKKDIQLKVKQV